VPQVSSTWTEAAGEAAQIVQWQFAWRAAVFSGLIAAVLSAMPVVGFGCCLWLLGAGALSVALYQRRVSGKYVTPGMGLRIGALSGTVAFVVSTLWDVFQFATNRQHVHAVFAEQMEKAISSNPDPKGQEIARQFMNNLSTPEGLATLFVIGLVIMAIVFVIFSAAGGALGASMFGRPRGSR
jgi:quinol-cytochrome oxidoreductase complex cytochrome b subunit